MFKWRTGWWLAALGLHALAWGLLHPIISIQISAPDSARPQPLRVSEVTLLAQSAPPARPTMAPVSPPSPSQPQTRPALSAASTVNTPAATVQAPATPVAPVAATPALPRSEPPPTFRESASLAAAPPGPNASPAVGAPSPTGRGESNLLPREDASPAGTPTVGSPSGAASVPALAPGPWSASGAADRAAGPRVDASWHGNLPPPYPLAARRRREEGTVRLDLLVEADGTVSQVRLRQSSGSAVLDRSVMQTVRHWRFVPARQDGQAIAAWYSAWEWVFRLEGG